MENFDNNKRFNTSNKKIIQSILNININDLSDEQLNLLWDLYQEYLRDGLKPKVAMIEAFEVVTCFKI